MMYLFIFGRTPGLSFRELRSFFPDSRKVTDESALAEIPILDSHSCIRELGGCVKVGSVLEMTEELTPELCQSYLMQHSGRVVFGISYYGSGINPIDNRFLGRIKEGLTGKGIPARFFSDKKTGSLSSVAVTKAHVAELLIVREGRKWIIARTEAVQPFEEWSHRDFDRPHADPKSGMLPLKVARMAVNIALGPDKKGKTLLDPFVGMGSVLGEAILSGVRCIGSDIAEKVLEKTHDNLDWIKKEYGIDADYTLYHSDATHISDRLTPGSVDAVVTEPFLGTTRLGEKTVDRSTYQNIIRGLDKLYIGCFRDWQKILKPRGKIFIALPCIRTVSGNEISVKKVIDSCEKLGYTNADGPLEYARPNAIVGRRFYLFIKKE